ncbi:MAG: hypothetical protein E7645_07875, partial [Ruminococcaceae bacterium]|nr:hypothetical protein [Oscillospiraceae bacterium]
MPPSHRSFSKYACGWSSRTYLVRNDPACRLFVDDGWSGTNFARPAFTEIMELAEAGQIGTLIVKDHSRLGR